MHKECHPLFEQTGCHQFNRFPTIFVLPPGVPKTAGGRRQLQYSALFFSKGS